MIPKKHWNETVAFWQTPLDWPGDQDDFVFLAKAVLQVERTLFPNAWIDDDPAHSYIALPPICQALGPKLERHQFPDLTDEAFAEIAAVYDDKVVDALIPVTRFRAAIRWIVARAKDGRLRTGLREYHFGDVAEASTTIWKTERHLYEPRFRFCQMHSTAARDSDGPPALIFVRKDDLDRELALTEPATAESVQRGIVEIWKANTGRLVSTSNVDAKIDDDDAERDRPLSRREKRELLDKVQTWLNDRLAQNPSEKTHTRGQLCAEAMSLFGAQGLRKRWFERELWPGVTKKFTAWEKRGPRLKKHRISSGEAS